MTKTINAIKRYCTSDLKADDGIMAIYLFGSILTEQFGDASDIDLAVWVDPRRYARDPFLAVSPVHLFAAKISRNLSRETDVTVLNGASIELAYDIVTRGLCMYEKDDDSRIEYEIKIKGMYFDFMPFIASIRKMKSIRRPA